MFELLRRIAATFDTFCWPTIGPVAVRVLPTRQIEYRTWIGEEYRIPASWVQS